MDQALCCLVLSSRTSFMAPFAYQRGIVRMSRYFTLYATAAIMTRAFGASLMERVTLERMLAPSVATLAVGTGFISFSGSFGMLDLVAVVGGLGHGYLYPSLSALVIGRTPMNAMGRSSTIYTSLYDLGAMVGPYLLGVVAHFWGYGPMFVLAGMTALLSAVYVLIAEPQAVARRLAWPRSPGRPSDVGLRFGRRNI